MKLKIMLSFCALAVFARAADEVREIVLAERGKEAEYAIVIPAAPGASVRYAAEELRDYVCGMTGVELPIVVGGGDVATRKAVYLRDDGGRAGRPRPAVMARPEAAPYQDDSFRIYTDNGNLYVIGGKRGVLYGVYELLETYGGVGWFSSWRAVFLRRRTPRSSRRRISPRRSTRRGASS